MVFLIDFLLVYAFISMCLQHVMMLILIILVGMLRCF